MRCHFGYYRQFIFGQQPLKQFLKQFGPETAMFQDNLVDAMGHYVVRTSAAMVLIV